MKRLLFFLSTAAVILAACSKNAGNDGNGDSGKMSVTTEEASELTMDSAVLNGSVSAACKGAGVETGFILSRRAVPDLEKGGQLVSAKVGADNKISAKISDLPSGTSYTYIAFAKKDTSWVYGEILSFTTAQFELAPVDMGLSVKWANCNIGAKKAEDYGDHFAWGETEKKADYSWGTYKWGTGMYSLTKYNTDISRGPVDGKTVLDKEDDAAAVILGGSWRMPTAEEWAELIAECYWEWTTQGGNNGYKVTSRKNGAKIFLPAAGGHGSTYHYDAGSYGRYWASTLNAEDPAFAWNVYFVSDYVCDYYYDRYYGRSVRAVQP